MQLSLSLSGGGTASLRADTQSGALQLASLEVSAAGQVVHVPVGRGAGDVGEEAAGRRSDGGRGGARGADQVIDVESWSS